MEIKIEKSKVPILWLDTWAIVELVRAVKLTSSERDKKKWGESLFSKITHLTNQKKILCPEADQLIEIETWGKLVDESREFLAQISRGISTNYYSGIEDIQIQRAMKVFINGEDSVIFPWEDLFLRDPIEEIERNDPFIISVRFTVPKKETLERIKVKKSIAKDWEQIRRKNLRDKESFNDRVKAEFNGRINVILKVLTKLIYKRQRGIRILTRDIIQVSEIAGKPLSWWNHYDGKKDEFGGLRGLIEFYKSEYFRKIPSVFIYTQLLAKMTTDHEKIKPSDIMDVNQIASILPYAQYMVLDGPMRDKVVYKLKLDKKYNTKIIRINELEDLLNSI